MAIKIFEGKSLRNMSFTRAAVASLEHVALVPEVQHALLSWLKAKTGTTTSGVLIGGLAMSFYSKPRYTEDVDLLFLKRSDIPSEVQGFRRNRPGAFEEEQTQVEIEVTSHESFSTTPASIVAKVIETAKDHGGLKVASLEGLIALKLCAAENPKRMLKDLGDVETLIGANLSVTMKGWPLTSKQQARFKAIKNRLQKEAK